MNAKFKILSLYSKLVVVNSFAKKNASRRDIRNQISCSNCNFRCVTPILMKLHYKTVHTNVITEEYKTESCAECKVSFLTR